MMGMLEKIVEWGGVKRDIAFLIVSAAALALSLFRPAGLPVDPAWIAIVLCGLPIVLEAVIGLVTEFDIKADVLVSIALIASVIIGEYFAAGEVALIMQLGALLEDLTVAKARAGIERLVDLTPSTAHVIVGGSVQTVDAAEVRVGDTVRVLPGETVPVDGIIEEGQTSIDQSVMTGESMPVDKSGGDEVKSGTVNQFGAFTMRATKVGEDSSLARMIRLVQSADAGKAKIVRLADRWATWIVVIALASAALTWFVTEEIIRAVTILVVFCPCALVLATPTAIMAAIGNLTKVGILVREGDALERLAKVRRIVLDKTGTLTYGKPEVVAIETLSHANEIGKDELYALAAAAEASSEHPLGKAVAESYRCAYGKNASASSDFEMLPGRGVCANVEGRHVLAGNAEMMIEREVSGFDLASAECYVSQGCTIVLVAVDGVPAGFIALSDTIREDARSTVASIGATGIQPVLLTGDHAQAAGRIAAEVGIADYRADCLPEDKLAAIEAYERSGERVCMVGDGVNDAPALKKAYVGVAMGGIGSDIAVDAADIALVHDDIAALPHMLALAKRMMKTIKLNMAFSMALNFIAIILAMAGILDPVVGALVHNAGSVIVIVNSALLLRWGVRGRRRKGFPAQALSLGPSAASAS